MITTYGDFAKVSAAVALLMAMAMYAAQVLG
jgi:hypothetical protein